MNPANSSRSLRNAARWSGRRGAVLLVATLPVVSNLLGCSFQDFSYLQESHTGSGGAGGSGGSSGTGGTLADAAADSMGADASNDAVEAASLADADAGDVADTGNVVPPSDAPPVNVLVNASFEQGLQGWSFDPMTAEGKYAYTQVPVGTATIVDGTYELATWHGSDAFRVRIFQTFTGLEAGRYTFKGWFNRGDDNAAFVYSAGCGGADQQLPVPLTNPTQWIEVGIGGINVTNSQCEVGFVVDANPTNWLNADAFSFERDPQ